MAYLTVRNAPGIGVHSAPHYVDPALTDAGDVLPYSTLENLFGEMDYCTCEHCRSILSPAAYLVHLLQFLEPAGWRGTTPQEVLLSRRPDIQHLPLTCENTNTPLPYIDLVNETLEYYITNGLSLGDTDPSPGLSSQYTGHTTDGSVKPEELLACPQFVHEAAYDVLAGAYFPPPLPFHRPLELLRRLFRCFEAPLPEVMEALRTSDSLDADIDALFGWRDVWMERLGLSRTEHRLLTQSWQTAGATDVLLTLKNLYGFDPVTSDADMREVLDNAKAFSRRVGLSYQELVEILRTRFVNPNSDLIPKLERLGVAFATLRDLKDGRIGDVDFDALLDQGVSAKPYGGGDAVTPAPAACAAIRAWVCNDENYGRIMGLLTLTDSGEAADQCSFDSLELRYSNPDSGHNKLRNFEFIRILRFIRLWKKLGWSIRQTDKALSALYPQGQIPEPDSSEESNLERLDAGFLALLPSLGIVVRVMELLNLSADKELPPLLACMGLIDNHGEYSLYRQLFLSPEPLDEAFVEAPAGGYLLDRATLLDHEEALRAALSLTSEEFNAIMAALGFPSDQSLDLESVSAIYRRGWLARTLKLSVRELLLLIQVSGYDPFVIPDPTAPAIVRLIEWVERLRTGGVKLEQALYLVWNHDLSGKSSPADAEITGFARTLRGALAAIEAEYAVVDDPDGTITRARMALVYGSETTDQFFGLLECTFVTEVAYDHDQPTLEAAIIAASPGRIGYDDFRKRLSYTGVLSEDRVVALQTAAGPGDFHDAVALLYEENQKVVGPFFERHEELRTLHDTYVASAEPVEEKRTALLAAFLPVLKHRRKRQQALQSISSAAASDIALASVLLEDAVALHAAGDASTSAGHPAILVLTALETPGLAAEFFHGPMATGAPDHTAHATAALEYGSAGAVSLQAAANAAADVPISGIWSGYLEVPENGHYNIRVETDPSATVTLTLNGSEVEPTGTVGSWSNSTPIQLRAGSLYTLCLKVENVLDRLTLSWQSKLEAGGPAGRGWEVISARFLYSESLIDNLRRSYLTLLKAAGLVGALKLTAEEFSHFAVASPYQISGEGWLNRLPLAGTSDPASTAALFQVFDALLDFSRLKQQLSPGDEGLLRVLGALKAETPGAEQDLYTLTRWEKASVDALLAHFGNTLAELSQIAIFRQIFDACSWLKKLGVPASTLIKAATNEPTAEVVRHLQAALRARYESRAPGWRWSGPSTTKCVDAARCPRGLHPAPDALHPTSGTSTPRRSSSSTS